MRGDALGRDEALVAIPRRGAAAFLRDPTSCLELIQSYKDLLAKKQKEVKEVQQRYTVGLEKLVATEQSVAEMKEELIALQPKLVEAGEKTAAAMVVIAAETEEADKVKELVAKDEATASRRRRGSRRSRMTARRTSLRRCPCSTRPSPRSTR